MKDNAQAKPCQVQNATSSNLIDVRINGKLARALVDTGSDVCLIKASSGLPVQGEVSRKKILAANGQALEVVQQATCQVQIGRMEAETLFYIVEDLADDVILGVQFLMQNEITMDFRDRVVSGKTNCLQCDIPLISTRNANN